LTLNGNKAMPFERENGRYRVEDYPWLVTYRREEYPFYGESEEAETIRDQRDDYLDLLWQEVQRAATAVAFQWPGVIEAGDAAQSIALRLLESPGSLKKIAEMDDAARYRALVGMGHQLASQEREDYDYYKGSYRYSVAEVKEVLKRGVLTEPVEGFDEAVFDLAEGLEALVDRAPQYVEAITKRYADAEIPKAGSDRERLSASLANLADEMNKSNRRRFSERDDGPGTRTAISNAQAQFISTRQYSGDGEVVS
jgi:hypothetical protein